MFFELYFDNVILKGGFQEIIVKSQEVL